MSMWAKLLDPSFVRLQVPVGETNGIRHEDPEQSFDYDDDGDSSSGEEVYETASKTDLFSERDFYPGASHLTSFDPSKNLEELEAGKTQDIFDRYNFDTPIRNDLPVSQMKRQILDSIRTYQVTVISGHTGSGKTTQVPQYVLDECRQNRAMCNIVVTQPRRIAAASIAKRVCMERGWPMGTLCGFQIGLKKSSSEDTRLLYCTTGVFLQMLLGSRDLSEYSHIFLDEVHERTKDLDFCLLLVRQLLTNSMTKVILMSATMDADHFVDYFRSAPGDISCNKINISTPMRYNVTKWYLEDLQVLVPEISVTIGDEPVFYPAFSYLVGNIIHRIDQESDKKTAFLVFLPGIVEIASIHQDLLFKAKQTDSKWKIIPLHSSIPSEDQRMAFETFSDCRKIILATNIAESSITVPDVEYVIDFCLTKHLRVDKETGLGTLQLDWASKYNCEQRAGRVGRVSPGRVYRLVPKEFYNRLPLSALPEMLTAPLESVVLQAKLLCVGNPLTVLSHALDRPALEDIYHAVLNLKESGGLLMTRNGEYDKYDGDMTFIGRIMAKLPVDYKVAKLIAFGYIFGVLESAIIIGASLTVRGMFTTPYNEQLEAYRHLLSWSFGSGSDLLAAEIAYKTYNLNYADGRMGGSDEMSEQVWARKAYLQLRTVKEIHLLVEQLTKQLQELNVQEVTDKNFTPWPNDGEKETILKFAIAAAFYPNYYETKTEQDGTRSMEEIAEKAVNCKNPFRTVYLTNFPSSKLPGEIYYTDIANKFYKIDPHVKVEIKAGCEKVLLEFSPDGPKSGPANRFPEAVYCSLLLAKLNVPFVLQRVNPQLAINWLKEQQAVMPTNLERSVISNVPSVTTTTVSIHIMRHIDPGHFWSWHVYDPEGLAKLEQRLYAGRLRPFTSLPIVGTYCIVVTPKSHKMQRAQRVLVELEHTNQSVKALEIDYGNRVEINLSELFFVDRESDDDERGIILEDYFYNTPAYAIECQLAEVGPTLSLSGVRTWSPAAYKEFHHLISGCELYGKVFSVVESVLRIKFYHDYNKDQSINDQLVKLNLAETIVERCSSLDNHRIRELHNEGRLMEAGQLKAYNMAQLRQYWPVHSHRLPPPPKLIYQANRPEIVLRGPKSPLECSLQSVTLQQVGLKVNVARDSINAIIMNNRPEQNAPQTLVSAHVTRSASGTSVTLHQTTLMPPLPGMAAILSVLFAPRVEYRPNCLNTRYASALCGMGVRKNGRAVHRDHDFDVNFEFEFKVVQATIINQLRKQISLLLNGELGHDTSTITRPNLIAAITEIRKSVTRLLCEQKPVTVEYPSSDQVGRWGYSTYSNPLPAVDVLPAHQLIPLSEPRELLSELDEINLMKTGEIDFSPRTCPLCGPGGRLSSHPALVSHLSTRNHKKLSQLLLE